MVTRVIKTFCIVGSPFWIECADETEYVLGQFNQTQFVSCYKDCGFTLKGTSGVIEEFSADIQGPILHGSVSCARMYFY